MPIRFANVDDPEQTALGQLKLGSHCLFFPFLGGIENLDYLP